VRVQLIIHGPGFAQGQVIDGLASLIDLPVTLLRAAGIDAPTGWQGNALQQLAGEDCANWPEDVFIQISETQVGRALRTAKWKYSVRAPGRNGWLHSAAKVYREDFLYDLENDPHELHNLVRDSAYEHVRAELRQRLIERMAQAGEKEPVILGRKMRVGRR